MRSCRSGSAVVARVPMLCQLQCPGVEPGPSPPPPPSDPARAAAVSTQSLLHLTGHEITPTMTIICTVVHILKLEHVPLGLDTCYLLVRGESCSWITIKTHKVSSAARRPLITGVRVLLQRDSGTMVMLGLMCLPWPSQIDYQHFSGYLNTIIIISTNGYAIQLLACF